MNNQEEKKKHLLQSLVANFINRESNRTSLITVTDVRIGKALANATVFLTVLPETQEAAAIDFLTRKSREMAHYVLKNSKLRRSPRLTFVIDKGEQNRQALDRIQ
jgi:ribosome-binding factor A